MGSPEEHLKVLHETNYVAHSLLDVFESSKKPSRRVAKGGGAIHRHKKKGGTGWNLLYPLCSITWQKTGRASVMGTRSVLETHLAFVKFVHLLNVIGYNAQLSQNGIAITNVVCAGQTYPIDTKRLCEVDKQGAVRYDPVTFEHAAFVDVKKTGYPHPTNIVIEIFASGTANIPGSKSLKESIDVFEYCERNLFSKAWIKDNWNSAPVAENLRKPFDHLSEADMYKIKEEIEIDEGKAEEELQLAKKTLSDW